jgi:hypothetical protein
MSKAQKSYMVQGLNTRYLSLHVTRYVTNGVIFTSLFLPNHRFVKFEQKKNSPSISAW